MPDAAFRLGFVPGVTPAKWVRTWRQRHELPLELVPLTHPTGASALSDGTVDAVLLRPPVDRGTVSAIPLYTEVAVVLAPKDHPLAALQPGEEAGPDDLADEVLLRPLDDVYPDTDHLPGTVLDHRPATTADAVQLVAAGTGLLVVPMSLARLHHRRDLVHRPLAGGPGAPVLLAWRTDHTTEAIEDFIGIVRGRTVSSTRGRRLPAEATDGTGPETGGTGQQAGSAGRRGRQGRQTARTSHGQGGRTGQGGNRRRPSPPRGRRGGPRRRGRR